MGTSFDYRNADHATLYAEINGGAGGEPVANTSGSWQALANEVRQVQLDVSRAVIGITEAQEGASADAATAATEPLVPWLSAMGEIANQLAANVAAQEEQFSWARRNIGPAPEISDPSFAEDASEWFANKVDWMPGLTTQQETEQAVAQAEAQRAREVMQIYQTNSNGNLAARPVFDPPPGLTSDVSSPGVAGVGSPGSGAGGVGGGQAASVSPVSASPQLAGAGAPGGAAGVGPGAGHGGGSVGTTPQFGGAAAEQAGRVPAAAAGASGGLVPPVGGGAASGGTGLRGGGDARGGGGARGAGVGGAGVGGTGRAGGGGATGGFGPRGGSSGAGGPGAGGPQSGTGDAATRAGGSATAGARGAPGGMGAGMAGAGAGGGRGQDSEHRRPSWLVEQDETAITGTLPPTLPAGGVIGAEAPEDW